MAERASNDAAPSPAQVEARAFARVRRLLRLWTQAPVQERWERVMLAARDVTPLVPDARRADWDRLLAGFEGSEDGRRRRARVEGLARACALFERSRRESLRATRIADWDEPVERAEGIGPAAREKLAARGVRSLADLLWTLPTGWDDLRSTVGVGAAIATTRAAEESLSTPPRLCVRGVVRSVSFVPMRGRRAVRLVLADADEKTASLDAWWFFAAHGVLAAAPQGQPCVLVGRLRVLGGKRPRMAHPDLVREGEASVIRARYPNLGVAPGALRRAVKDLLAAASAPPLPDPVPAAIATRESMPPAELLLRSVHGAAEDVPPRDAWRELAARLAWVEAFTQVWQRLQAESQWGSAEAPALTCPPAVLEQAVHSLGFALTGAQRRAVETVSRDISSPTPMRRLLLGDVGTGKTAVALVAAAQCAAAGFQCALLVPTGLLVDQYALASAPLVQALGIAVERVTAGMRAVERRAALAAIESGRAQVVVGTHALLEEGVRFARLGLCVVDEQQRLGVAQRLGMVRKGDGTRPHLLSLSATPIPRTMALALRGELATSVLDERPRGRVVVTRQLARGNLEGVIDEVRGAVGRGERVFFVCPRIEDDDEQEQAGAEARAARLSAALAPARVGVVHGAMSQARRVEAMRSFRAGDVAVLVGTTVMEVGLDVPQATLMVIDGAEQFGLAQLHQLRGRVGRGERPGLCLLVHDEPLAPAARGRLDVLCSTDDGAEIARADLKMRGGGELGGTRQSGVVEDFLWLDPGDPPAWIERIEEDARSIARDDPALAAPGHRALASAMRRVRQMFGLREEAG